jgi:hypothetical protein
MTRRRLNLNGLKFCGYTRRRLYNVSAARMAARNISLASHGKQHVANSRQERLREACAPIQYAGKAQQRSAARTMTAGRTHVLVPVKLEVAVAPSVTAT